jgi:hypothetical protein
MSPTTQGGGMGAQGRSPDEGRMATITALLRQADIQPGKRASMQGANVVEASAPGLAPQSLVVFQSQDEGMHLGLKVGIPANSALVNQKPYSDSVLLALGALTVGLGPLGLRAELLSGSEGAEGFLIIAHACDPKDPAVLRSRLVSLRSVSTRISEALAVPSADLVAALRASLGVRGFTEKWHTSGREAVVVPTFDTAVRDRMMKETGVTNRS